MSEVSRLLDKTDTATLKAVEPWTEEQHREARMQVFGKWRMAYLNALYARGLRGDLQKELDILAAIDAFQDFIRDGRLPDDLSPGEALLDKPWLRKGIVGE